MLLQSRSLARLAAAGRAEAVPSGGGSSIFVNFTALSVQDPLSNGGQFSNNTQGVGGNGAPLAGSSMQILTRTGGGGVIAAASTAAHINYEDSFAFIPGVIGGLLSGPNYRVTARLWIAAGYAPVDNHEFEIIIGCKTGNYPAGTTANNHRWVECLWSLGGTQETIDQNGDYSAGSFNLFGSPATPGFTGGPLTGDDFIAEYYPASNRVRWGRIRSGTTTWAQDTTNATYINPATLGNGIGIAMFRRSNFAFDTVVASAGFENLRIEGFE